MSDIGKLESAEKTEKPENPIKETSEDLIDCIKEQKSEVPEKTEAFDGLIECIEKLGNLTEKLESSDFKTGLNELSNSLQEFKGQNEKLDKAIEGVIDKINDVSEIMEEDEVSFQDIIDAICLILKALLPIILAIL
jgi:seryl-tRNA synthetase